MHTVAGVSGRFRPYDSDALRHFEVPRPQAVCVLGTLLFVLDKYGAIYVLSTYVSGVAFPFTPPAGVTDFGGDRGATHHAGLYASPETLVAVYSNGRVRRFSIAERARRTKIGRAYV